jgi:hypothetical protein
MIWGAISPRSVVALIGNNCEALAVSGYWTKITKKRKRLAVLDVIVSIRKRRLIE